MISKDCKRRKMCTTLELHNPRSPTTLLWSTCVDTISAATFSSAIENNLQLQPSWTTTRIIVRVNQRSHAYVPRPKTKNHTEPALGGDMGRRAGSGFLGFSMFRCRLRSPPSSPSLQITRTDERRRGIVHVRRSRRRLSTCCLFTISKSASHEPAWVWRPPSGRHGAFRQCPTRFRGA